MLPEVYEKEVRENVYWEGHASDSDSESLKFETTMQKYYQIALQSGSPEYLKIFYAIWEMKLGKWAL